MTVNGWLQIAIFAALVAAVTLPLGGYMVKVFAGERTPLSPVLRPVETVFYRLSGVDPIREQNWLTYAFAVLLFNLVAFLLLYALQRLQGVLPLNPQGFAGVAPDLALNTSISFVTNTNWQNYGGESTLSYLVQMAGLTAHNFVSAANGIVVAMVLIRGFARKSVGTIGNFWVDLTRCTLYVLLPISIVAALVLIWQGMPQNLNALHRSGNARRRQADDRPGPDRLTDRHQDSGHQRRRLLQRQRRASFQVLML
jgi:potassium-transporting ATPase potassium-binding subunit